MASVKRWLGLATLMLAVLLVSIDNTVLSFAIPEISSALRPTGIELLWIVDVYALVLAGLLITMGTLADRYGRRRTLLIGAAGFGAVSLFAAFSESATSLIIARALLGVFGATLMPSTLALIRNLFADARERRLAIAIWAAGFSAGAALGPIVGGWLLEHFWWGSIFLINVPVIIVFLCLTPWLIPESRDPHPAKLDLLSASLVIAAMLLIVFGIKTLAAGESIWLTLLLIVMGAVLAWFFVNRQITSTAPMLDVRLFRIPTFSVSVIANLLSLMALTGLLYYISQYLQLVLDLSPSQAALYLLPGLISTVLSGLLAVRLADRFSLIILIPTGLFLSAAGFFLATQIQVNSSVWFLVTAFVFVGAGVGLAETLTNDAILSTVPAEKAGAASGISETAYEVGALMGTAVLGSILTVVYQRSLMLPVEVPEETAEQARETLGAAIDAAKTMEEPLRSELIESSQVAFTLGADVTSMVAGILVAFAAILVGLVLWKESRNAS